MMWQGTSVTVEVARKLGVPRMVLVVNKVPAIFDTQAVKARVEDAYQSAVAVVLPHSEELMALASPGILCLALPDQPVTAALKQVGTTLVG